MGSQFDLDLDKWCSQESLQFLAPNIFRIVKRKKSLVFEVVQQVNGETSICMSFYLPVEYHFMDEIVLIHNLVNVHPLDENRADKLVWGNLNDEETNEGFSVTASYNKLLELELFNVKEFPCAKVWRKGGPLKVQFFPWSAALNRISTFDLVRTKGIVWVYACLFCLKEDETGAHLLIHCPFSTEVWRPFLRNFGIPWAMPQWSGISIKVDLFGPCLLMLSYVWSLWEKRNARSYNGVDGSTMKVVMAAWLLGLELGRT